MAFFAFLWSNYAQNDAFPLKGTLVLGFYM